MNKVYEIIDKSIKEGLTQPNLQLLLSNLPGSEQVGTLFDLLASQEYILKRFINACMSTDAEIREHSAEGLRKWSEAIKIQPNVEKLFKYVSDVSNYKKGGNKKSEIEAFAVGRTLVVKSLAPVFKNVSAVFESLAQIVKQFEHLEQEAIEACHLISFDKLLKLKFHSLAPKSKSGKTLHKLFLRTKDPKADQVKLQDFTEILQVQTENFPKKSILLFYFGKLLTTIVDTPLNFFRKYANQYLDNDTDAEVNIHQIYSLMTVLKGFLDSVTITEQNYSTYFDKKIIAVWLEQFRVLNKKMKGLAQSISINFQQNNKELANKILIDLHEDGVYLENISPNHPLAKLYEWVDAGSYWQYIYNLCLQNDIVPIKESKMIEEPKKQSKKKSVQKTQKAQVQQTTQNQEQIEEEVATYFTELEYFMKLRFKDLQDEHLCQTIILLLNKFHKDENQKELLYLCINLMNIICKIANKKKGKGKGKEEQKDQGNKRLNKKMLLILNALDISQLNQFTPEQSESFKKCIAWSKKTSLPLRKQAQHVACDAQVNFFNFYNCVVFFCLLYPEEIETCQQLQMLYQDLLKLLSEKEQTLGQPKKKSKKSKQVTDEEDSPKKPVHVLTDIFISLMTKPPIFLRKSIHNLFEDLITFLDESDIGNMLTVITTPDAEFIQEM